MNPTTQQQPITPPADLSQIIRQQSEVQFITVNRYQVQQNAVFIDYQPQQLKKSIQQYHSLKFYHRLSMAKNIQAIEDTCQDKNMLYTLMLEIAKDHQDIQKQLIEFYRMQFITHSKAKPQDYQQYIFTPLMTLIQGVHLQIKQQANRILSSLKGWISAQEKKQIIKMAIEMGHNNDEQNKIVSIQLIVHLTPDLSQEQNEKFFLQQYTKLYNQSSVRVKKQIITELKVLGENVSKQFFDKQMIEGFYLQKCLEKVWGVRKACVQIISQLVKLTSGKKQALANALLAFTKDGNKIVKVSAFKAIPQFLANYQSAHMPQKLMQIYLRLMDHEINGLVSRQNEILNKVSFFFPGVLYRAGGKSWQDMRKLFQRLIHHRNQQVKKPIASSLHEISSIIGPQLAKQHMFTALDTILKDKSDSLKLDAIDHLSQFVRLFDTVTRENLIDVFLVLQKDPKKWRVRYSIAHQLKDLAMIYETQTVFKYIFPISLKLCNDNVSQVRIQAARQIYFVIDSLTSIEIYKQMAIESIKGFGLSQKFVQRQTFAAMVQNLYRQENFQQKFIDVIQKIAVDPVIVVRIALAISISKAIKVDKTAQKKFVKIIQQLKKDEQVGDYLIDDEEEQQVQLSK